MKYAQKDSNNNPINIKLKSDRVIMVKDGESSRQPKALALWSDAKIRANLGYYPYKESPVKPNRFQNEVRTWVFANNKFTENVVITPKPQPEIDTINAAILAARQSEAQDQLQNNDIIKAVVMAINDGTLVTGANKTNAQLRAIIKDHVK